MIQYEGTEFIDNPADKGGATKFGINEKFISNLKLSQLLPSTKNSWLTCFQLFSEVPVSITEYIQDLTMDEAKMIYQKYFWFPVYEQIKNRDACDYIFDMTVNHGAHDAAIICQRASRAIMRNNLKEDGIFGEITLEAINIYISDYFGAVMCERAGFMRCIVARDPSQKQFLEGWLKRAYGEKL